jgi:hypothetical protein
MSFAPFKTTDKILGAFTEKEFDNMFEFSEDTKHEPIWHDFPVKVWVAADQFRWAKVLKTVAHVVIDEDAEGKPVTEKWSIKNYRAYA